MYEGLAGDVIANGHFHNDENSRLYYAGRFDELARRLAPAKPLVLLPRRWQEAASAVDPYPALINELTRYRDTCNPMMFFYFYNRIRRAVSVVHLLWGHVLGTVHVPFLEKGVFDFLAGLPEEMFANKDFDTQALARAHPGGGEIAFAKKTPAARDLQLRYATQGLRFALSASSPLLDRRATFAPVRTVYAQSTLWRRSDLDLAPGSDAVSTRSASTEQKLSQANQPKFRTLINLAVPVQPSPSCPPIEREQTNVLAPST